MRSENPSSPVGNQIRVVPENELAALKLTPVVKYNFTRLLRAAEKDRKAKEDLYADRVEAIGRDRANWIVYVVTTIAFRGDEHRGETLAFAIAPGAQHNFEKYVTKKLSEEFEKLKLAWMNPELLWVRKPIEHRIPRETVESVLTSYLAEKLRPEWDNKTTYCTDWHLQREDGLRVWAQHETQEQLKIFDKPSFDLEMFRQTELRSLARGAKSAEKFHRLAEWLHRSGNFEKLNDYLRQKGTVNPLQKALCVAYDRAEIPLEFWSSRAISQFLGTLAPHFSRPTPSEKLVQTWLSRLKLKLATPTVVVRYFPREDERPEKLEINQTAAWFHGMRWLLE